jgi:hypothetical protein
MVTSFSRRHNRKGRRVSVNSERFKSKKLKGGNRIRSNLERSEDICSYLGSIVKCLNLLSKRGLKKHYYSLCTVLSRRFCSNLKIRIKRVIVLLYHRLVMNNPLFKKRRYPFHWESYKKTYCYRCRMIEEW